MSDQVAVMNRGVFEQVGAPRALYDRPATAFVAGFVGEANRWRGRVARAEGGSARIVLGDGTELVAEGVWARAGAGGRGLRAARVDPAGADRRGAGRSAKPDRSRTCSSTAPRAACCCARPRGPRSTWRCPRPASSPIWRGASRCTPDGAGRVAFRWRDDRRPAGALPAARAAGAVAGGAGGDPAHRPDADVAARVGPRQYQPSLANYRVFFDEPLYWSIFLRTAVMSVAATVLTLLIAFPVAYYIAKLARGRLNLALFMAAWCRSGSPSWCGPSAG